jgi:hypothetical protein
MPIVKSRAEEKIRFDHEKHERHETKGRTGPWTKREQDISRGDAEFAEE